MLPLYQWHVYASGIRQASKCAAGFTLGVPERRVNELLSSGPCAHLETSELHDSDGATTWACSHADGVRRSKLVCPD